MAFDKIIAWEIFNYLTCPPLMKNINTIITDQSIQVLQIASKRFWIFITSQLQLYPLLLPIGYWFVFVNYFIRNKHTLVNIIPSYITTWHEEQIDLLLYYRKERNFSIGHQFSKKEEKKLLLQLLIDHTKTMPCQMISINFIGSLVF